MLPALRRGKLVMPHSETAAIPRTVLEVLCTKLSLADADTTIHVASNVPEAAEQRRCSLDDLREVAREALHKTPTMWP